MLFYTSTLRTIPPHFTSVVCVALITGNLNDLTRTGTDVRSMERSCGCLLCVCVCVCVCVFDGRGLRRASRQPSRDSQAVTVSDKMLNTARLSCVLFCSTLYPASCTVEVSRLILSVLGCTLVTKSTKSSHVPLVFGQLSDTLISDRCIDRCRKSEVLGRRCLTCISL
jgi:hypothetical protein